MAGRIHLGSWFTIGTVAVASLSLNICDPGIETTQASLPQPDVLLERALESGCDTEMFQRFAHDIVGVVDTTPEHMEPPVDDSLTVLVSAADLDNSQLHDCQRLIGPEDRPGTLMESKPLVALLVSKARVQSGAYGSGMVIADVINYGPGMYEPLGIPEGLSCLWIRSGATDAEWIAGLQDPGDGGCAGRRFGDPTDTLDIRVLRVAGGGDEEVEYPPTGRWMWDPEARIQFIGSACGDAWCEIGLGFTGTGTIQTQDAIPGWGDEQILSYMDGGRLVLSDLLGRVDPGASNGAAHDASLASVSAGADFHVADMSFSPAPNVPSGASDGWAYYQGKYRLGATADMAGSHPVWLTKDGDGPGAGWKVRTAGTALAEVLYTGHEHSGSGTVRWSWADDDEGLWIPCEQGCCKTTGW